MTALSFERGHTRYPRIGWTTVAAMFAVSIAALPIASERIPIHWNIDGQVDGTAPRVIGLLAVPSIGLGLAVLALLLPRIDPGKANYANFRTAYWKIILIIQLYLFVLNALIAAWAIGWPISMSVAVPLLVGILLIAIGNYLRKLRPNWMIGIRTPWTLSSKRSWDRTHRLGSWLMILMGLLMMSVAAVPKHEVLLAVGGVGFVCLVTLVVYSWYIWRNDPDRVSATQIRPAESVQPD